MPEKQVHKSISLNAVIECGPCLMHVEDEPVNFDSNKRIVVNINKKEIRECGQYGEFPVT